MQQLTTVQEQGYALDSEEITRGIICLAAPVFGLQEDIICAISITFPPLLAPPPVAWSPQRRTPVLDKKGSMPFRRSAHTSA